MRRYIRIITGFLALFLLLSACGGLEAGKMPGPAQTTPSPTPDPTPTPDPILERAEAILAGMTAREKLCQLMIVRPEALEGEGSVTAAGENTKAALAEYPVGGFIYSTGNLVSREQTAGMIETAQSYSRLGLFICADEEGGNVGRLMYKLGTTWFDAMYSYKDQGTEVAYGNANTIGGDMLACRFNTDFAPVADVRSNPKNAVIGDRAYSDDFSQAAELVAAAVNGFRDSGVICCLKHFPGHGDTLEDSHKGTATVDKTWDALLAEEMLTFKSGIAAGADMVMAGHINVPAIDDRPASMSHTLITGMLRGELGFDGVVITDGLDMGALEGMTDEEKCLAALNAGCDLLLGVSDISGAVAGLEQALSDGRLTAERVDESVLRVLVLKLSHGIAA